MKAIACMDCEFEFEYTNDRERTHAEAVVDKHIENHHPVVREQPDEERELDKLEIIIEHLQKARHGFRALRHSPLDAKDMIDRIAGVESRMLRVKTDRIMVGVRACLEKVGH